MTTIAVIPARGGSKSIPLKNARQVGGLTLVQRSIIHARQSSVDEFYVSSDSDYLLRMAKECKSETIRRPPELADDDATGDAVLMHALGELGYSEKSDPNDLAVFLQPTSPLRPPGLIDECITTLILGGLDSVFTAHYGHFAWRIIGGKVTSVQGPDARKPRQKIPPEDRLYLENGCVYVCRIPVLFKEKNRICGKVGIVRMEELDAIDIDSEWDLWLAEMRTRYSTQWTIRNVGEEYLPLIADRKVASWK